MKRGASLFFTLALCGALPASAIQYEIQRWDLEAGTEVFLVEDHRAPLIQIVVEFPVGHWSRWARDHHAEEAFDIQFYDVDGDLRARADALSVDLSVGMYSHSSRIRASCLREDVEPVLKLVRDVIDNRAFDGRELKRWNESAKLGWSRLQKEPKFRLGQAAARLHFAPDDPRRRKYESPRPRITNIERLTAARDIVVRLPGRAIGFAGDLTRDEAQLLAAKVLPPASETLPDGLEPRLSPLTPMDRIPPELTVTLSKTQQSFFRYGRHSLTYNSPQYPAFLVADHVLGGHFFSRLSKALRHEGGETYGASTAGRGGSYRESYALGTFTRADNADATEAKLRQVLRTLNEDGITEEEREAAIGYMRGHRLFSRQAPSQILERFMWERRHGLPAGFYDDLTERAAKISLEEINVFVREFYSPSHFGMVIVAPK